jgi:hypothetical protein
MARTLPSLLAAMLVLAAQPMGQGQDVTPQRSPRNASYQFLATLDPEAQTISGSGRIVWRNITKAAARDLRFHLYWNGWRDANSTWMREQALARGGPLNRPPEDAGSIEIISLVARGQDLLKGSAFVAPDDGNTADRTVLATPLATPVQPGETIDIDVTWTSKIPRTFARTGRIGQYYFIAQWFPKLGVFQDNGEWNAHQFHAATEFFSDFGSYDIGLVVPKGWIVGATGVQTTVTASGENEEHHFRADDVHDFAWTTSPDFVERTEQFQHAGLPTVTMRLLLQPRHVKQADRHFAATRAALRYYGEWFGPYPYPNITIVDPVAPVNPAVQGGSTGGMEYPTLFTAGTRNWASLLGSQPEAVTVHEAGHQFWYGIVATNEFEHAWMDEGFNTWSTARVMEQAFPNRFYTTERYFGGFMPWAFTDAPWSRDIDGNRLNAYRPAATSDVQSTPTWQYWPGTAGVITYNKTSLWLATLERYVGQDTMQRIMATHFARGAFRHPTPDEFFAIASEVSGRDLAWFFDATVRSRAAFDYAVSQVTQTPSSEGFESVVVVRRLQEGIFPVTIKRTYEDGSSDVEAWDGQAPWKAFTYRGPSRVAKVEIDPDRVLMLDVNYTNNSWTARPYAPLAARKWSWRWMTWVQEVMLTYGFFS